MEKSYKIPCVWQSWGLIRVTANSLEEAITKAQENIDDYPLPDAEYVDDSFKLDLDDIGVIETLNQDINSTGE